MSKLCFILTPQLKLWLFKHFWLQRPVWTGRQGQIGVISVRHLIIFQRPFRWGIDCKNPLCTSGVMIFLIIKLWFNVIRHQMTSWWRHCSSAVFKLRFKYVPSFKVQFNFNLELSFGYKFPGRRRSKSKKKTRHSVFC